MKADSEKVISVIRYATSVIEYTLKRNRGGESVQAQSLISFPPFLSRLI